MTSTSLPRGRAEPAVRVRPVRARDLRHLAAIEESGLPLHEEHLGDLGGTGLAAAAPSGHARDDAPGFLLVAVPDDEAVPVGFAHVLVHDASYDPRAHLEQLSVTPSWMRRGVGSAMVEAALRRAHRECARTLTLCTYRDLPWCAPFYARLGFDLVAEPDAWLREVRAAEQRRGLDSVGERVVMARSTATEVTGE